MDLRDIERESIRAFVQSAADDGYLSGRVLDYGCGKQPYRDIVEAAGGEYVGYDTPEFPANVSGGYVGVKEYAEAHDWQAILCTQVVQYMEHEQIIQKFGWFQTWLLDGGHGHLVLTYPTNWPEVEPEDLHRFTKAGMERLLTEAGFEIVRHEMRATVAATWMEGRRIQVGSDDFVLGYGCIARA